MLTHTCGKMLGCFADITGITAHTCKLINHTRTKPVRDGVFHAKHVAMLYILYGAGYQGKTSLRSRCIKGERWGKGACEREKTERSVGGGGQSPRPFHARLNFFFSRFPPSLYAPATQARARHVDDAGENNLYQKLMFENFSSVEQTSSNMDAKRSKIVESTNVLQRKERLAPGFYNMKITHVSRAYATRCSGVLGSRCQRRCCGEVNFLKQAV